MNKYKWQINDEVALEYATNTSFNVNAASEYSVRFKKYIEDGGIVDPADPVIPLKVEVTKSTAYDRIETLYGEVTLNQVFDILDALPRKERRFYDDATAIDCDDVRIITALQSININPADILY